MRVRVKFSKYGVMKFIGHLDVMRYFQKAMRRAGIDIAYSEGMSPHMIMSFAQPLGVGLTSDGEYMDVELRTPIASDEAIRRLNEVGVEGITVTEWRQIPEEKGSKAMTLVEKELDIRPLVYDMYVNAGTVYFRLSAGSEANIKPELVMDAYLASIDVTPEPFAYEIHRRELYADLGKNGKRKLVPLGELGQDVVSEQV